MARLRLRVDFDNGHALGPGKVRLLELVGETGSISAAARGLGMSYRRAWLLIDDLNHTFRTPVLATRGGGAGGGGADLTIFGRQVVEAFRAMETEAETAVAERLKGLEQALIDRPASEAAPSNLNGS